ncbi:lycopene cyclase family protein [Meiothermus hypogaeus]|uniref:Lycopene cyclase n=2 Tax=Meiothermus hypogaeus TaxID=884155 RepID=A0A511R188_9DEIN|nr:lycopene cyclase family protein [Meiothermus hypogaeus]RIH75282.1 lycopene cyclase family protein [Meiothermus hypogaeus]GEM83047.1 lycopene cyclase [Meiothermus hypogaeus NBRC 106114]GIW37290.1 MAG: lycopene cyclase [Meiothermus sp.]
MSEPYDYIIAGAGASGLSLAYYLMQAGLREKRILLLDRAPKTSNDRTWCFWEVGEGPFENVVFRKWNRIWFHGEGISSRLEIAPYTYKMIRGLDFYAFMNRWVSEQPNIVVRYGEVSHIAEREGGVEVGLEGQTFRGRWAFSSLYRPPPQNPRYHYLLQHFKGWVVRASRPVFDTEAATFMDFRVAQQEAVRFVYVLPFDAQTALVEYTLFSPELLPPEAYDAGLREYLKGILGLESYEILESEFGIIPMTDAPFPRRQSAHVINIGMAGGRTKASTGYTFRRIQEQSRRMAEALQRTGQPFYPEPALNRHAWMDSVLLNVLGKQRSPGKQVFSDLFRKNPPERVLRFLDEETGWLEDLQIMASVDIPAFLRATLDVLGMRWQGARQGAMAPKRG